MYKQPKHRRRSAARSRLFSWTYSSPGGLGYSSVEIAVAYVAGYMSAAEAIVTAYYRGRSIITNTLKGATIAAGISVEYALELLEGAKMRSRLQQLILLQV